MSPGSAAFRAPITVHSLPQCRRVHSEPLPVPSSSRALPWSSRALVWPVCAHPAMLLPAVSPALPLYHFLTTDMVRTRGGSRLRPRVRFSTPKQEEQAPATATVPDLVPEESQGFRRYQTRIGPQAPSSVP